MNMRLYTFVHIYLLMEFWQANSKKHT